jgi:hypothetical protein
MLVYYGRRADYQDEADGDIAVGASHLNEQRRRLMGRKDGHWVMAGSGGPPMSLGVSGLGRRGPV